MASTAEASQRQIIISVLLSQSAQRINFKLASYFINGFGFHMVVGLLKTNSIDVVISAGEVASVSTDAEAVYNTSDKFYFPYGQYGMSMEERATIVHESVHALIDYRGGGRLHRRVDDEAAAHLAEALFVLHSTHAIPTGLDDLGEVKFDIAKKIRASRKPVPVVSQNDLSDLRQEVMRAYRRARVPIRSLQRDQADGVASPMRVFAPLYIGG
jgi:hypothetical protein